MLPLYREAEQQKIDHERSVAVLKKYQENIRRSGTLQSDILKGLQAGEDIHSLFLKAVEAIALMTNDNIIYSEAEQTLQTVYGVGEGEEQPLQAQLDAVEKRLYNLEESLLWYTEPGEQRRIQRAITAHKKRAEKIRELLAG